jgi:hypothetical protein
MMRRVDNEVFIPDSSPKGCFSGVKNARTSGYGFMATITVSSQGKARITVKHFDIINKFSLNSREFFLNLVRSFDKVASVDDSQNGFCQLPSPWRSRRIQTEPPAHPSPRPFK